jgi:SAM-dependent methyltransferase
MMAIRGLKIAALLALHEFKPLARLLEPLRAKPELYASTVWDEQYRSGKWKALGSASEAAHNLVVAAYAASGQERVLDVGCGSGGLVPALQRFGYNRYLGIDLSAVAVAAAASHARENTAFRVVDGDKLDAADTYDSIVFNETLYYFTDPVETLRRYQRLLAPGGRFVVSMADVGSLRDALLKHRIWRGLEADYRVADETIVYRRGAVAWTIRVLAPRHP